MGVCPNYKDLKPNIGSRTKKYIYVHLCIHLGPRFHAVTICNGECFTIENYKRNVNQNVKKESVS